jgi:hypothetical protein
MQVPPQDAVQVVSSDDALKQEAITVALAISKNNRQVVEKIKQMQHAGLKFDVDGALDHEARVAVATYERMAKDPKSTRNLLSATFQARAKL